MRWRKQEILVIGLGRFGGAIAETLVGIGHNVLGVDANPRVVEKYAGRVTNVAEADTTSVESVRQLGADDFATAVVAVGDIEASILTTAALTDLGVRAIWAKAITEPHARILERVGAHHVVFPERDMGVRMAHMLHGGALEYIQLDSGFALVETHAPRELFGKTLSQSEVRRRFGVTVVCVKPSGSSFTYATPETVVSDDSVLVVAGEPQRVESFAELARQGPR